MGFRYRKSIKIAPGVKVNVGKKSVGVSVGGKYGGVSVNSKTGARARVSAPGTGMSYTTKIDTKTDKPAKKSTVQKATSQSNKTVINSNTNTSKKGTVATPDKRKQYEAIIKRDKLTKKKTKSYKRLFTFLSIFFILIGILLLSSTLLIGILSIVFGLISALCSYTYGDILKTCFNAK